VDLLKIHVIHDWSALETMIELCSFLGLTNFYRWLVLGFSHVTWALSHVTKGGKKDKFLWYVPQQKEFEALKLCIFSTPILILPNLQQPFDIVIDYSYYAIGAVFT
jgi:hypothetical protein